MNVIHAAQPMKPGIGNIRASLLAQMDETEKEKMEFRWRKADEIEHGPMPATDTEDGRTAWLSRIHKRVLAFFRASNITNPEAQRQLVKEVRDIIVARNCYDVDFAFDIAKVSLQLRKEAKGRSVLDLFKDDDMATKMKQHDPLPAGTFANAKPSADATPDPIIVERAQKLDDALDGILREMDYKDTDLTLRRNVYRPYGGATALKVVQHADYVQLKVETAFHEEIARMQKGPEKVSELDEYIPRCKIHNEPLNDAGKCTICELNKSVSPDEKPAPAHWSLDNANRGKFWGDVNGWFNKYDGSRTLDKPARESFAHAVLGGSTKETKLSQVEATEAVKKAIDTDFSKPAEATAPSNAQGSTLQETKPTEVKTPEKADPPQIAPNVPNLNGVEKPAPKYVAPLAIQTLTGVPMQMIRQELDKPLPPQAYSAIKYGTMKGKTDIDVERIRDRFDQVFGSQGLGWAIEPIPNESHIATVTEIRQAKDKEGNPYDQTWFVIDLVNYRLRYTVVLPDGSLKDCYGTAMSESGDNMDRGYALEGTMSSLMKQAYRRMGGMNHVYYGAYTHIQAQRDLNVA